METLLKVLGPWGRPPDLFAWFTLALAAFFLARALLPTRGVSWTTDVPRKRYLMLVAFAAAFLSLGYIAHYLRGGPRIIDATSYFLQGRALSHGHFSWTIPEPSASFRGRFLLFDHNSIGGIFPPGYPLLLAVGFLVGAPLVVGPLLAAMLVLATYALAFEIAYEQPQRERIARLAAVLSVLCAAVRYHTADTMSHGAAALAIAVALTAVLRARRLAKAGDPKSARWVGLAGLAIGYVSCTRPASALPIALVALVIALRLGTRARVRSVAYLALGIIPGLAFLALANRSMTGDVFSATQRAYYATSDGPPNCFRYGFGFNTGCMFEHGDFVRAHIPMGYDFLAAIGTTLRRLRAHLTDVANLELLAPLVLFSLRSLNRTPALAFAVVLGQFAAYVPFYFDGSYPGGGARLFADVLPIEHALLALSVVHVLPKIEFRRRAYVLLALACTGFAIHASHDHMQLAKRDGGRPMFEPDRLREASVTSGIVFFETDHGFNLAHNPGVVASHGVVAARLRNDDHDKLLFDQLGHPPSFIYRLAPPHTPVAGAPPGELVPTIVPYVRPGTIADVEWRFESEADWPALEQKGGWAEPIWASATCSSGGRALAVIPGRGFDTAEARIYLPVPQAGVFSVRPRTYRRPWAGGEGKLTLLGADGKTKLAEWLFPSYVATDMPPDGQCKDLQERDVYLEAPGAYLVIEAERGEIALDRTSLLKRPVAK